MRDVYKPCTASGASFMVRDNDLANPMTVNHFNGRGEIRTRESLSTPHAFQALTSDSRSRSRRSTQGLGRTRRRSRRPETRPNIALVRVQNVYNAPLGHGEHNGRGTSPRQASPAAQNGGRV